jgi:glycosyltransferase involved in cell wall biosynthesis
MKLHFIQSEATPHNNLLIKELAVKLDLELTLWYSREDSEQYTWSQNPTHVIQRAHIYGDHTIHWPLVLHLLRYRTEKVFQVGWASPTTRMLVVLFFLSRRRYNMWTDYPNDSKKRGRIKNNLRELFYCLLKYSKANVFCVGKMTVDYFVERGFSKSRLINMPIPVDTSKSKSDYLHRRSKIREKYYVKQDDLFLVSGSRLTFDKGYDLLIKALSIFSSVMRRRVKALIIGEGEEKKNLLQQIQDEGLTGQVFIEDWMEVEEYLAHIANADVYVHPARFDAYGGSIFAMALGVPVLGSSGAGAVIDNIESDVNGIIFQKNNVDSLNKRIAEIIKKNELAEFGTKMRQKMVENDFKGSIHEKLVANLLG